MTDLPVHTPASSLSTAWPCGSCGKGYMPCYDGWLDTGRACCPACDAHSARQRQTGENADWPERAARGEQFPAPQNVSNKQ